MSRSKITFLFFLVILLFAAFANPLKWPLPFLESYVLGITPIGSSFDEVNSEVGSREWDLSYASRSVGFSDQRTRSGKVVGHMSIRASLGNYQGIPFVTNVTVFWGFDSAGSLIDIWVWKTKDGF